MQVMKIAVELQGANIETKLTAAAEPHLGGELWSLQARLALSSFDSDNLKRGGGRSSL